MKKEWFKISKQVYQYLLGAAIIYGVFFTVNKILSQSIPIENKDVAYMALGQILGIGLMVVNYFYSSSKGSADKTDIIAEKNNKKEEDE